MSGTVGGYEWGYTCPECDTFTALAGMWSESHPIVNGETSVRERDLESGDTIECPECGAERTLTFVPPRDSVTLPVGKTRLEAAMDLLRRHHYSDIADDIEAVYGDE